jgi:hypothetical protein
MAVVIVRTERRIDDLAPRLLGERASAMPAKVRRAIRDANPHVDVDRLQPGDVVTIPDNDDVRVRPEAAPEDLIGEGMAAMVAGLRDVVDSLVEQAEAEAKVEAADRAVVRRSIGLKAVEEAASHDRHLQDEIGRVTRSLADADEAAQEASAVRKRSVESWRQQLEILTDLG